MNTHFCHVLKLTLDLCKFLGCAVSVFLKLLQSLLVRLLLGDTRDDGQRMRGKKKRVRDEGRARDIEGQRQRGKEGEGRRGVEG